MLIAIQTSHEETKIPGGKKETHPLYLGFYAESPNVCIGQNSYTCHSGSTGPSLWGWGQPPLHYMPSQRSEKDRIQWRFCLRGLGGKMGSGCETKCCILLLGSSTYHFYFFFTANFTLHLFIQRTVVESLLCARYCWVNFAKTEIWTHSLSVWELQWLPLACLVNVHVSPCPPRPQACVHVHSHSAQTRCPQWFLGCFNAFLTPTLVYRVSSTHHSHLHCQNPNSSFKEENATYYITLNPNFTATILTTLYFVSCIARCFTRYLCHAKSTGSACNYPHFLRYNLALL